MNKKRIIIASICVLLICVISILKCIPNKSNTIQKAKSEKELPSKIETFLEIDELSQEYIIKDKDGNELRRTDNPILVDLLLDNPNYNPNPLGIKAEE